MFSIISSDFFKVKMSHFLKNRNSGFWLIESIKFAKVEVEENNDNELEVFKESEINTKYVSSN